MLHLPQMGPFEVLITLLPLIQNYRQLSLLELSTLLRPCFGPTPTNTVFFFWDFSSLYTSTVQTGQPCPPQLMDHSRPTLVFKLPTILPSTLHSPLPTMFLGVFLYLLFPLPRTCPRFFNKMLEVSKPGAVNYNIFARLILLTLFVSRNPTLT